MKNLFFLMISFFLVCSGNVSAQLKGKQFLSGTAQVLFSNNKADDTKAANGYGYNFAISLGKFKTNTIASGWNLNTSLSGSDQDYIIIRDGVSTPIRKSGINGFGVGVGRFWQFYKHFNEKTGIYAGPDINLGYNHTKDYETISNGMYLSDRTNDQISLSLGVSAGLYYKFSDKWWVTANIAVSSPVHLDYNIARQESPEAGFDNKVKTFDYALNPGFTFPSVGFGLRYFYNR
jgi:hypothetical protein